MSIEVKIDNTINKLARKILKRWKSWNRNRIKVDTIETENEMRSPYVWRQKTSIR